MSSNNHPNNWCIVNVQLDPHRAEVFYRMKNALGGTVSKCMRMILNPIIDDFEKAMKQEEKKQAERILGIASPKEDEHDE